MRTAFSTLGCPNANLPEVIQLAVENGISGLELRVHEGGIVSEHMSPAEVKTVQKSLLEAGLTVVSLGTYVKVCAPDDAGMDAKLERSFELAELIGAEAVRVFPGAGTSAASNEQELSEAEDRGVARLARALRMAETTGVRVLLETHDSHPRGVDVARVLSCLPESPYLGSIWDVLHPWSHGETPDETAHHLGHGLAYIQLKDARRDQETGEMHLVLPSAGDVPLERALEMFHKAPGPSANKWVSLEWEKAWHHDLPDLSEALSAFAETMKAYR